MHSESKVSIGFSPQASFPIRFLSDKRQGDAEVRHLEMDLYHGDVEKSG
jgi:hypothetical protein